MTRSSRRPCGSGNRLIHEPSLYLRQHALNPVDWHPWGEEALGLAVETDRPIFLSVGYSSCHWCHVMEHEVFEEEEVAGQLNAHYVCIKVDREERPDLDAAYMAALQALTGNGGWPMSLFLTPERQPFFAGTYFPRDQFLLLVTRLHELYREHRADLDRQTKTLSRQLESATRPVVALEIDESMVESVAAQIVEHHDRRWGGLRGAMKFPTPTIWHFLLHRYRRAGGEELARALHTTLDAIASGGMHDHLGGGFHRYTIEPTWLVPHFEKMLYDNAQLAGLYLEASVVLECPRYAEVARDTLDFLAGEMTGAEGGFCSSFDADSGGQEGIFYLWTPEEITATVGLAEGPALATLLGVTAGGNFEGRSILTRRREAAEVAAELGLTETMVAEIFSRWRPALREAQRRRTGPALDRKIVTSWNGLAISAFAQGAALLGEGRYLRAAEQAARQLWRAHRRPDGSLYRSSTDGTARGEGVIADYANLAVGLLDLFEASQDLRHLRWALELVDQVELRFKDKEGYALTPAGHAVPLGRQQDILDTVRPSGSAAMIHALLRLGALLGRDALLDRARQIMRGHGQLLRRAGLEMAWWLDAGLLLLGPPLTVVISGEQAATDTCALEETLRTIHPWHAGRLRVPAGGPSAELAELIPSSRVHCAPGAAATAFVCRPGSCGAPTSSPTDLRDQILDGWHR